MYTFPLLPARSAKIFLTCLTGLVALLLTTTGTAHHKPGHSGGPGGDDGGDPCVPRPNGFFPAMIYSVDAIDGSGNRNLMLGSSDGCMPPVLAEESGDGYRLQYSRIDNAGFYTWTLRDDVNNTRNIWRQDFDVIDGTTLNKLGPAAHIYESQPSASVEYDIREHNGITTLSVIENGALRVINPATCIGRPCNDSDGTTVYSTAVDCWNDLVGGCYNVGGVTMNVSGDHAYVGTSGEDTSGNPVKVIGSVELNAGAQIPVTKYILTADTYPEAGIESLSSDGKYLAVGYLAGFLKGGLRDDRIIFLDNDCTSCGVTDPLLPNSLAQDISSWNASWTVDDTVILLGNEGRRRKLKHPMFEFDPFDLSGVREPLGIVLGDHPPIDSSL